MKRFRQDDLMMMQVAVWSPTSLRAGLNDLKPSCAM